MEYDGEPQGGADKDVTVEILSKKFTVLVPKKPVKLEGKKYGTQRGEYIDWVVKVDAPDETDIAGYTFKDNLSDVGEYVKDSFKIGKNTDVNLASKPDPDPEPGSDKILTYEFPSPTVGTNYIFFTTEIPEDKFYANALRSVDNTAKIFDGDEEKLSVSGKVTFDVKWIEKVGGVVDFDAETNTGYIIWTITANPEGLTLPKAVITDELPTGLSFVSAEWFEKPAEKWESQGSIYPDLTTESIYELGDISTPVMLQIKAKVDGDVVNIGHEVKTFTNSATITWENYPGPGTGVGTTSKGVGIGLNPINKKVRPEMGTAGTYDKVTHKIPWEVTVVKSDVSASLYVLDLLVYGASFKWSDVHSLTVVEGTEISGTLADLGTGLTKINNLDEKPTEQFNQKYDLSTFASVTSPALHYVVYTLKDTGGKAIADLLLVTGPSGASINPSTDQTFTFDTLITNPDVYANHGSKVVKNTAVLYSANKRINLREASVNYPSKMLYKDMLKRDDATNPVGNKNESGANSGAAFDYKDHTIVYRLHINANGLDLTGGITPSGLTVGNVTLTDILPDGWDFVKVDDTNWYLMYEGTPGADDRIDATTTTATATTADFNGTGQVTFTFDTLDKPYVILLKAKATDDKAEEYFSKNQTFTITNTATLTGENWLSGITATRNATITSQILGKEGKLLEAGVVKWTIDYKPNTIKEWDITKLEDKLPEGLDIRINPDGTLNFGPTGDENITGNELVLQPDGKYTVGSSITFNNSSDPKNNVSYHTVDRILTFENFDATKPHRFTYITDVTADPGATVKNEVKLTSEDIGVVENAGSYFVADADASATMTRTGSVLITKSDGVTELPMKDVVFNVFAADETTLITTGKTDASGKLTLRGLPVGTPAKYILKEVPVSGYFAPSPASYEIEVTTVGTTSVTKIDGGSNELDIQNFKEDTYGDLKISKSLLGSEADATKDFEFELSMPGLGGKTYKYIGGGGKGDGTITFDAAGKTTFTLRKDQTILIKYLPKGSLYTVTEKDYKDQGYATVITGDASGSVPVDDVEVVTFTNSRVGGWFEITKSDADGGAPLSGAIFTLYENDGVTVVTTQTSDASGKAWFLDLLPGTYKLKETTAPSGYENQLEDRFYTVVVDDSVSPIVTQIEGVTTNALGLVNYKNNTVGDLILSKTLAGNATDPTKDFELTLEMPSEVGKTYSYIGGGTILDGSFTFDANGKHTFDLKGGDSVQIKYLPKDMDYTVTEKGYTPDGYTTTFKDDSGNIIADDVVTAAFVNYRNRKKESVGSLHISKTVAGNDGDKDKGFTFKVEFDKGSFYHFSGVGIPGGTIKSGDTFTLSHGQSITITGLPEGTEYKVTENDYRDEGYETSATNYKGTIIKDSIISAKFTNTKDVEDPEDPDKPGDPDDPNKPGDKPGEDDDSGILGEGDEKTPGGSNLPKTGDPSLLLLWFLTMAGALFGIYWLSRKKPLFTRK